MEPSEYLWLKKLLDLDIPDDKNFACLYLESHGFKFCVNYGYDNAVEKAREHWKKRKRKP